MPELPEVETIATDLNKRIKNLKVIDFKITNERTQRLRPLINFSEKVFKQRVVLNKIISVDRRAKHLVIDFGNYVILIHLKMTGQLVYKGCKKNKCEVVAGGHPIIGGGENLPNKFTRAIFELNDGSTLYFNDVRRFGWLKLLNKNEYIEFEKSLGLEPLSREFTLEKFKEILERKRNVKIKQALLEQKYLVGIGNIYADESLFLAKIKPMRQVKTLTVNEIKKLWQVIPKVLKLAIKHRGTSFNDYRDAQGEKGNFINYLNVYGRAGQKCKNCNGFVLKIKIAGRGTHWCDRCQK